MSAVLGGKGGGLVEEVLGCCGNQCSAPSYTRLHLLLPQFDQSKQEADTSPAPRDASANENPPSLPSLSLPTLSPSVSDAAAEGLNSAAYWISAEVTDASYPTQHHRGTGDSQHTNEPPRDTHTHTHASMHKYAYVNTQRS